MNVLRALQSLPSDLGGEEDLFKVSYSVVFGNVLAKLRWHGSRLYPFLQTVVPHFVLLVGLCKTVHSVTQQVATTTSTVCSVFSFIAAPLTASVTVPADHPLNADVLAWLSKDRPGFGSTILTDAAAQPVIVEREDSRGFRRTFSKPSAVAYIPSYGTSYFWFGGYFMTMDRKEPAIDKGDGNAKADSRKGRPLTFDPTTPQLLVISCFPTLRSTIPIERFLDKARGPSDPPKKTTTSVHRTILPPPATGTRRWETAITRSERLLDSVALKAKVKDPLVKDIENYLQPSHRRFCANRGYPYRYGMLLYGPPGTGKTSFAVALAGNFNLDVYIISLSDKSMTDRLLEELFAALPNKCVLLMEDVDCSGIDRGVPASKDLQAQAREGLRPAASRANGIWNGHAYVYADQLNKSSLTLGGLLNCLDGPMSKDGRILCMTSNHRDSLDPALVRAGRCHQNVHFGNVSAEICETLFEHLYTERPDELVKGETRWEQDEIFILAKGFASRIPSPENNDSKISPAEVQDYLMRHRRDPRAAVDGAKELARKNLEVKAEGKNVAAFESEM
jgi:chaperone BCS1